MVSSLRQVNQPKRAPISLESFLEQMNQLLVKRLRDIAETGRHSPAARAFSYALATPGKLLRPKLALAVAAMLREQTQPNRILLDAAVAIECVHTASLVLDDLPSMDGGLLRRGAEPTHQRFGEGQATLAAFAIIAEANRLLDPGTGAEPALLNAHMQAKRILNQVYSLNGLVGGQSLDLAVSGPVSPERLLEIHHLKTGTLFQATVTIPAVLCFAQANEIAALEAFAAHLGLAFQIKDDLLDLQKASVTGKASSRAKTHVSVLNFWDEATCRKRFDAEVDQALACLERFGAKAKLPRELALWAAGRPAL